MKLTEKTIKSVVLRLKNTKSMIVANNGNQIENIKDELYDILQEIDEENHKCYTHHEA